VKKYLKRFSENRSPVFGFALLHTVFGGASAPGDTQFSPRRRFPRASVGCRASSVGTIVGRCGCKIRWRRNAVIFESCPSGQRGCEKRSEEKREVREH
jgi:hypothetical protein